MPIIFGLIVAGLVLAAGAAGKLDAKAGSGPGGEGGEQTKVKPPKAARKMSPQESFVAGESKGEAKGRAAAKVEFETAAAAKAADDARIDAAVAARMKSTTPAGGTTE